MQTLVFVRSWQSIICVITFLIVLAALWGCAQNKNTPTKAPEQMDASGSILPLKPQPSATAIRPGLSVLYFYNFNYRDAAKIPTGQKAIEKGRPGKPIPFLNHSFGPRNVFDSKSSRKIAMLMTGMIKLPHPGQYRFMAISNDGIQVFLDKRRIISDPDVHSDRPSQKAEVNIADGDWLAPGWYPLTVKYYQRKGTATIKLFWQRPNDADFAIIPAEAYAHMVPPDKSN